MAIFNANFKQTYSKKKYVLSCAFYFLVYRNLSNNKLTEIEDGSFEGASSVIELHLTANQIDSVRSGMFRGLEGLRMLWVMLKPFKSPKIHVNNSVFFINIVFLPFLGC